MSTQSHRDATIEEEPRIRKYARENACIFWGDALEVLRAEISDNSVDLIFSDPPYNIGKNFAGFQDRWSSDAEYVKWCYIWLDECIKKLKSSGSLYIMTSTQAMPYLDIYLRDKMCILSRIIWSYDSSGVQARKYYGSLYEPILFCVKNKNHYTFNASDILVEAKTGAKRKLIDYRKTVPTVYNTKKVPGNVWYLPRVRYRMSEYEEHPSQKPEALLARIIEASSNPGDLILDPFSGTFTTSVVAKKLGRRSIGIELQKDYIKIGIRRLGIGDSFEGEMLQSPKKIFQKNGTEKLVLKGDIFNESART